MASADDPAEPIFLFLAAEARYRIDRQVYPPTEKGSEDPGVLIAALRSGIGPGIAATLESHPESIVPVIERLEAWKPDLSEEYRPGWRFEKPLDTEAAQQIVDDTVALLLKPLRQKASLLRNDRYRVLKQELAAAAAQHQKDTLAFNSYQGTDSLNSDEYRRYEASKSLRNAAAARVRRLEWEIDPSTRWHQRVGWKASDYFEDPQVISLCEAIERDDRAAMRRLLDVGVKADTVGRDGMTPLLWAFPDRRVERFKLLLDYGADPNVFLESDFGVGGKPLHPYPHGGSLLADRGCRAGVAVSHLACRSPERAFMRAAFAHGANANLVDRKTGETPLDLVFARGLGDHAERVRTLLEQGARPNRLCEYTGRYPVTQAVLASAYESALLLLKAGADPTLTRKKEFPRKGQTALHWVLRHQEHAPFHDQRRQDDYDALLAWLEKHYASELENVRDELDQGPLWGAALRAEREAERAGRLAEQQRQRERLAERLRRLPAEPAPPTAAERVAELSEQQLENVDGPAIFEMWSPTRAKKPEPWFRLEADGRLTLRNRQRPAAPEVVTTLDRDEVIWLMHLAINECGVMEKDSADYRKHQDPQYDSVFRYRVESGERDVDLELPSRTLVRKSLRHRLGLFPFKALNAYLDALGNQAYIEADDPGGTVLAAINAEAKKQDATLPPFRPFHLSLAARTDRGHLMVTYTQDIDVGRDQRSLRLEGLYVGSDTQPTIRVTVKRVQRRPQ